MLISADVHAEQKAIHVSAPLAMIPHTNPPMNFTVRVWSQVWFISETGPKHNKQHGGCLIYNHSFPRAYHCI